MGRVKKFDYNGAWVDYNLKKFVMLTEKEKANWAEIVTIYKNRKGFN